MNMTTATKTIRAGYKQTELGVIPEDWEVKKVGEICDFVVPGEINLKILMETFLGLQHLISKEI